jgi:hypothetical protein
LVVTNRLAIWCLSSRSQHGAHDLGVCPAATQIATHSAADVVLGWIRVVAQERDGGEDLTGRAEPALQRIVLDECGLDRMQLAVAGQAFNGRDGPIIAGDGER